MSQRILYLVLLLMFQGIGSLPGEYNIQLNKDVLPVVHPPRRVPVPKKEAMKTELDKMVAYKIIIPVTEPPYWVSSVLAVPKKDGSVRICLDPKDLNTLTTPYQQLKMSPLVSQMLKFSVF